MRLTILKQGTYSEDGFHDEGEMAINPCNPSIVLTPLMYVDEELPYTRLAGAVCAIVRGHFRDIVQQINDDMKA